MDCSLPGSSIHGISQARILEWVDISFSRRSSWPRDWTLVSCIIGRHFTVWATREVLMMPEAVNYSLGQWFVPFLLSVVFWSAFSACLSSSMFFVATLRDPSAMFQSPGILLEGFCHPGYKSSSVSSVAQLCPTLCDPMNLSTPGLPVHH